MENQKRDAPNEFNQFLEHALSLLKEVLHNVDNKTINPDVSLDKVVSELLEIEKQLDIFIDANQAPLEKSKAESDANPTYTKETLRLLKKTAELQEQAEKKREWLTEKKEKLEKKSKKSKDEKPEATRPVKERSTKSKLRRVGGNRKWKPV